MYPSSSFYNPRTFKSFWKPFVRVFQVLCVSHFSVFYSTNCIGRLIYFFAFSALHITFVIYTLFNGLHIQMRPSIHHKYSPLMFYMNFVSVFGNLLTQVVAHLEPLFTRKYEEEIYRKLDKINENFALKLNYVTNFEIVGKKIYLAYDGVFYNQRKCIIFFAA